MTALQRTKNAAKQVYENYKAPVPKWAKWARNIGIVIGAVGGSILAAPAMFPAGIVATAGYMVFGGNVTALIVQGFKK